MSEEPRGVVTNGQQQETTAHLNLTRTLADVWRLQAETPTTYPEYFDNRFTAKSRKQGK